MADDDTETGRRSYHESAYGDLDGGEEQPLDPSELPDDVTVPDSDGDAGGGGEGDSNGDAGVDGAGGGGRDDGGDADGAPDASDQARDGAGPPERTGLARTLDRIAEALATLGIYVALAATVVAPVALGAIATGVQPAGNYLLTASFAGWTVAMLLALLAGVRESDPYADAEEKKEIEQGFF